MNKLGKRKTFILIPSSYISDGSLKRSIGMSKLHLYSALCAFPTEGFTGGSYRKPKDCKAFVKEVQGVTPGKYNNCWLLLLRVLARTALLLQDLSYIQLKVSLQSAQPWMQEHIFLSKFPFCFNNTYNPIFTSRDESCPSPTRLQWMEKSNHTYWFPFLPLCSCFFLRVL